ncbi:hypothetical protein V6N12_076119 [Hibiscus sabdariffa]|uniref:Uncharacterized protein n=1 Tax=Hibiscus sabdariffa TaxID=183260 RepID=A0ABR1Z6V0_9ROSI
MERSELPLPASLPYSYCHTGLVNLLACLLSKPAHRLFTLRLRLPIRGMTGKRKKGRANDAVGIDYSFAA